MISQPQLRLSSPAELVAKGIIPKVEIQYEFTSTLSFTLFSYLCFGSVVVHHL